jgi:hypothetical protein
MIMKSLFAAAAVTALAAGISAPANAKVKVDLYVGGYTPDYYEPAYPVYDAYPPRPRHYPRYDDDYDRYGISCEEGRDMVRDSGFRKVRSLDCDGPRYSYRARRGGDTFIVRVSSRSGNIISVRPAY